MATLKLGLVNVGLGASFPGAILGATPNPYCCTTLSPSPPTSGSYLTTGSLAQGETGEFGGTSGWAVEFWLQLRGIPSATKVLVRGPTTAAIGSPRQWAVQLTSAGQLLFSGVDSTLANRSGTGATVLKTSSSQIGGWYHIVLALDSSVPALYLYVNGVQDGTAAWGGVSMATAPSTYAAGDAGSMIVGDGTNEANCDLTIDSLATYRQTLSAARVAAHYTAGVDRGFGFAKPGKRIIDVLDACQSVHAPRAIAAGTRDVTESYMAGQSPLDELQKAASAENVDAMLFVARDGTVTFKAASYRAGLPVEFTFGDAGGTDIAYEDTDLADSDSFIYNEWNVTRSPGRLGSPFGTGETQTSSDSTSIATYFRRSQSLTDVPVTKDSDASAIAAAMLAKYKDPMMRSTKVTVRGVDPTILAACLGVELGDRVDLKRTQPGLAATTETMYVQSRSESVDDDGVLGFTFGLSRL